MEWTFIENTNWVVWKNGLFSHHFQFQASTHHLLCIHPNNCNNETIKLFVLLILVQASAHTHLNLIKMHFHDWSRFYVYRRWHHTHHSVKLDTSWKVCSRRKSKRGESSKDFRSSRRRRDSSWEIEMRESESRRRCDASNDNSFHHDVKFNRSGLSSVFFSFSCYKFHAIKIIVYWLHEITLDKISFLRLCDFLTINDFWRGGFFTFMFDSSLDNIVFFLIAHDNLVNVFF